MKVAAYILIGVGSLSMALGFFGCIGAIYEIRCLLGLVRTLIHSENTNQWIFQWNLVFFSCFSIFSSVESATLTKYSGG